MKQGWLRQIDWQTVVSLNKAICDGHNATHGPTSDGYAQTEAFWFANHQRELTLTEAIEICGKCHRLAPFCNYNGATFTVVIRDCIAQFTGITVQQATAIRSIAGHMVAGTATPEEITQFGPLIENLDKPVSPSPAPPHSFAVNDRVQTPKGTLSGVVIETTVNGEIKWKCDQTAATVTGTPNSLKPL
jgi:hypothetical protein